MITSSEHRGVEAGAPAPFAVEMDQVTKSYPNPEGGTTTALKLAHLSLPAGQELALAGPSGSGKSTLLNIVAGLLLPTSGSVRVLGQEIPGLSEVERDRFRSAHLGYVFQTGNLLGGFSAVENLMIAMGFAGTIPRAKRRARAMELLREVGLGSRLNFRPSQLSAGQQQRVAIARAVVNEPALVLADEPTAHLDYETGEQIVSLLRSACSEHGAALLVATHDLELLESFEEVVHLGDRGSSGSARKGDVGSSDGLGPAGQGRGTTWRAEENG